MERHGRYYLGRVVKINLDQVMLMDSIVNAPTISIGKFDWTVTDVIDGRGSAFPYIFGKLSKFAKNGHVTVIDEVLRSQVGADAPNLLEASSPFVYLPEFSGMAFLHVWDGIQEDIFARRFQKIIEAAHDGILVSCVVQSVTDYEAFATRLRKLDEFTEISAKVFPPNPLFGRLWEELNQYIKDRNASEVMVKEQTSKPGGLKSKLVELMERIVHNKDYQPEMAADIGDAAILMAADGYGRGKVVGTQDGSEVVVRTSETQMSFLYSKEPVPLELAIRANDFFESIVEERDMRH